MYIFFPEFRVGIGWCYFAGRIAQKIVQHLKNFIWFFMKFWTPKRWENDDDDNEDNNNNDNDNVNDNDNDQNNNKETSNRPKNPALMIVEFPLTHIPPSNFVFINYSKTVL